MMTPTSVDSRAQVMRQLAEGPLDLLIIGGGIVGSGVARDAAMRGLRVGLIEKQDFAAGTSSRSSRLLHGGLRYLAQGRIGLVREASIEKLVIHRIAPHLAMPLPFIFPTRRYDRDAAGRTQPSSWKRWKLGIGVRIYDVLCNGRNLGRSGTLDINNTLKLLPGLNREDLTGAVRYFDGMTSDARLVFDTLRSAAANQALLCNYVEFKDARHNSNHWQCQINDLILGREAVVEARCVVNAAGAWADRLIYDAPANTAKRSGVSLRLTKGVHLVIDHARLPIPEAVVMSQGKRILFAIPWGERVILGTTDTDYEGPLESPVCDEQDTQYILDVTNKTFPSADLKTDDVISAWVGLRPLIAGRSRKGTPSDTSRQHQINMVYPGWVDVAGGKLTTYRLMAEQTVDKVAQHLAVKTPRCRTAQTPLLSDSSTPAYSGILPPPVSRQAVAHYCGNEWAIHLDDVMIRRSSWCYYYRDHLPIARQVAQWMAQTLGWNETMLQDELARYTAQIAAVDPSRRPHTQSDTPLNSIEAMQQSL